MPRTLPHVYAQAIPFVRVNTAIKANLSYTTHW